MKNAIPSPSDCAAPCDSELREMAVEYSTIPIDMDDKEDDESVIVEGEDRSQWSENDRRYPSLRKLRGMQRVLADVVLDVGTEPKDKAACARAWRDLEVLRYAKQGKPLMLNVTGKADATRKSSAPPSVITLADVQAA
jgi:hypothetical protein